MFVILMGVAGCGKTTIGKMLAAELGWKFYDADDFHPADNISKMSAGFPLTDDDRSPWLKSLRTLVESCLTRHEDAVLACSALKANYRDHLQIDESVIVVHLKGDSKLIEERIRNRQEHFMKRDMLASQLALLEEPEKAIQVDISLPPAEIVRQIANSIKLRRPANQVNQEH